MAEGSIRQQIMELLGQEEMNAMEISQAVGISEKEVALHLEHVIRTLSKKGKKLVINPYTCLGCGFSFKDRKRLKRPGRCPRCKGSHIRMATYGITHK
ncbi:MAG: transcriptional regulator [Thermodesulfobacteriota bacterium]